jgi:beta-glucosidase
MKIMTHTFRAACLALLIGALAAQESAEGRLLPYKDASLPASSRVDDLLARMTVEEKIGQTLQAARDYLSSSSDIAKYGLGSVLSGGGSGPRINDAAHWADMIDAYQKAALSSRLGIPIIYGVDAVHGNNNVRGSVVFPHNIGLGAANDPELVEEIGRITALEMLATGARWNFAPCVTVPRDERWGRTYEGFGESPELVGKLGAASIRGLQTGALGSAAAVLATAKHFAGDGGTTGGKDRGDAAYSEEDFMRIHVAPYVEAIAAGARCVMVSFSSWNGVMDHGNKRLLTDILRGKLGFEGFVVSDWGGVSLLPGAFEERIATAFNAGIDMIMVPDEYRRFYDAMRGLVASGTIGAGRLDEAVRRILTVKFEMGLFERPFADRSLLAAVGSPERRAVARRAVAESLVVLKNSGGVLPLSGKKRILVVGPRADDVGAQCGGWTLTWQGVRGSSVPGTTIFDGIKEAAGSGARVELSRDGSAPAGFKPDLAIVVIGEDPYAEMNGDSADLALGAAEKRLVDAAASLGAPVVAVLVSGRPLIATEELGKVDAFVAAWLPGSEGAGVADLLFGKAKARGVLPCSWPESIAQVPVNEGDGRPCLFPAGYGLRP